MAYGRYVRDDGGAGGDVVTRVYVSRFGPRPRDTRSVVTGPAPWRRDWPERLGDLAAMTDGEVLAACRGYGGAVARCEARARGLL